MYIYIYREDILFEIQLGTTKSLLKLTCSSNHQICSWCMDKHLGWWRDAQMQRMPFGEAEREALVCHALQGVVSRWYLTRRWRCSDTRT